MLTPSTGAELGGGGGVLLGDDQERELGVEPLLGGRSWKWIQGSFLEGDLWHT